MDELDQKLEEQFLNLMENEVWTVLENNSKDLTELATTLCELSPETNSVQMVLMLMALKDATPLDDPGLQNTSAALKDFLMMLKFSLSDRIEDLYKQFERRARSEVEATMARYQWEQHRAAGFRLLAQKMGMDHDATRDRIISFIDSVLRDSKSEITDQDKMIMAYLNHIEDIKVAVKGWLVKTIRFEDPAQAQSFRTLMMNIRQGTLGANAPRQRQPGYQQFKHLIQAQMQRQAQQSTTRVEASLSKSLSDRISQAKARARRNIFGA